MAKMHEDTDYCYLCGKWGYGRMDKHHVMNGAFRDRAEEDGLYIYVHRTCHRFIHEHPVTAWNLKRKAQRFYEKHIGTHEQWMERYGHKDYLASFKPTDERKGEE